MEISKINFTTTHIEALTDDNILGVATGFFYKETDHEYLVTNRHVVINKDESFNPKTLRIRLHVNRIDLHLDNSISLSLYDSYGCPLWLQHPAYSELLCDVVAIPMREPVLDRMNLELFCKSSIDNFSKGLTEIPEINPFSNVVVVGYPLGFYDEVHNLPVYRKAMIASQFGVEFRDKPYFLIDANLHRGTSGSPVVNSPHTLFKSGGAGKEGYKLFGIHSAEHFVDEQPLGLNVVWYSYIIPEIVASDQNATKESTQVETEEPQ